MTNAQQYLEENFKDKKISRVAVISQKLVGKVNFTNYPELEYINCFNNEITDVDLIVLEKLWYLSMSRNKLTNLDFIQGIQGKKLTHLDLSGNKDLFTLSPLSNLLNLEYLKFTDANKFVSGLESLPTSLEKFIYDKESFFDQQLALYSDKKVAEWKKDNKKWFDMLQEFGFGNESAEFELYWRMKFITDDFAKRLGIPIDFYPGKEGMGGFANESPGVKGWTNWRNGGKDKSGFEVHLRLDEEKGMIIYSLAHEISHDEIWYAMDKKLLSSDQRHSPKFWEAFLVKSFLPKDNVSTLVFVESRLDPENQKILKDFTNPLIEEDNNARYVYFPENYGDDLMKLNTRKKKTFKEGVIIKNWNNIWQGVFKLIEDSLDEIPSNWNKQVERDNRKLFIWVLHREFSFDQHESEDIDKYKVYIFYDKNNIPSQLLKKIEDTLSKLDEKTTRLVKGGWEEEVIDKDKRNKLIAKHPFLKECGECGVCLEHGGYQMKIEVPLKD